MLSDENDGEARSAAGRFTEARNLACDPLPEREGRGLSVDQLRRHPPK
jgi:hypothetical protein